jgi:cytochrome b
MTAVDRTLTEAGRDSRPAEVRVWDPLVRIFHWSLVAGFAIAWLTGDEIKGLHNTAGYVVLGLVAFRLIWGLIGTRHARFRDFVRRPAVVVEFLKDMLRGRAKRYIGHNPAGGAMIVALLGTVGVISTTGILMTTDAFWGAEWLEELHEGSVNFGLVLVGLHVMGVIFASFEHGENLVRAMVTGRKRKS